MSVANQCGLMALSDKSCCQGVVSSVLLAFSPTRGMLTLALLLCALVSETTTASPVDFEQRSIRIAMTQEPPNLNSTRATDLVSFFVLGHINEGLLRYDRRGRLVGGVAESWQTEPNRIVFKLRAGARWEDGSRVVAGDFVFAWHLVNDPELASPFAAIMHPIKNASAVQAGELPLTALGVRALDDETLEVQFEQACGHCLSLMSHSVFFPVKAAFYAKAGDQFGTEANMLLSNGPFRLNQWVHDSRLDLRKNSHYWNAESVFLNQIEVGYITGDNRTRLNLFRDNQIAFARLGAETVKEAVNQSMKVRTFLTGGVAYLWFNMRQGEPTSDPRLRRAIQAAFDPDEYVNQVIAIPGYKPTNTLFPSWFKSSDGAAFGAAFPPPQVERGPVRARKLLSHVTGDGIDLPPMTLLTVSSTTGVKAAEYLQGRLNNVLGLDIKVDQQTFKQYLNKARSGDFDLVLSSWYPDYDDIVTYADLLASYNPNNRGRYANLNYDRQLEVLMAEVNPDKRLAAAAELQKLIVQDVPVLPMAETSSAYLQHRQLKGVVRRVFGPDPDFSGARIVNPKR